MQLHHHSSLLGGSVGKHNNTLNAMQGTANHLNEAVKSEVRKLVYEYLATEGMAETFFKMQVY